MPVQFAHPRETLSTFLALEWTVVLVQPSVVAQAARVRKLFAARCTSVLFCTGMCATHMLLHIVQPGEFFSADQADVLTGVHPTVVGVLPASLKLLPADDAAVRLLAGMAPPVLQKFAGRVELLRAYVADERTLVRVLASVHGDRAQPRKSSSANVAVERTLPGVRAAVLRALFPTHE